MAYRNIFITNEACLTLKNKSLRIENTLVDDTIPIEDIDTVLIENRRCTLSTALLSALAQSGVALFICDEMHMPCAVLLPYLQHSRQHEITKRQLALSTPAKKRIWKQIVTAKIKNQAKCLELSGLHEASQEILQRAKHVKSGDSTHVEGHTAAKYFSVLFGENFIRTNDDEPRNAWLNYGYAIIRGLVARTLAVYGFFATMGIHHHSQLNQFNLADDFMEPFRPLIDLFVAKNATVYTPLNSKAKYDLINLINYNILMSGKKFALSYGIELCIKSFSSMLMGKRNDLLMPEIIALEQHRYE